MGTNDTLRKRVAELEAALLAEQQSVDVLAQAMPRDTCPNIEHEWHRDSDLDEDDCGGVADACHTDSARCWAEFARSEYARQWVLTDWLTAERQAIERRGRERAGNRVAAKAEIDARAAEQTERIALRNRIAVLDVKIERLRNELSSTQNALACEQAIARSNCDEALKAGLEQGYARRWAAAWKRAAKRLAVR